MKTAFAPRFPALQHTPQGLVIRACADAGEAAMISAAREMTATQSLKGWPPSRLAKELAVSVRTINRRCEADELPFVDNGTSKQCRRTIPGHVVQLVKLYGLGGVARLRKAGHI